MIVLAIMAALLVWGAFLARGAYLYNHNPWRAVITMSCVLGFLSIWGLLMLARKPRPPRVFSTAADSSSDEDSSSDDKSSRDDTA